MLEFVVPALLAIVCVVVMLLAYSLYRKERAAVYDRMFVDKELYAAGEAGTVAQKNPSRIPVAAFLHEAGIGVAPAMWCSIVIGGIIVTCSLITVLTTNFSMGIVVSAAVPIVALAHGALLRRKRRTMLDRQIARILPQVSAGVRSSLTLERALRAAAGHSEDPLREELARVLADVAYGTSLTEAFEGMTNRTASPDVKALAAAIRIQQRFGGPISPVLDMITDHANARLKTSRELKTELAGTRLAKWFVAASMPIIFLIMFVTNADFARFYTEEPLGWIVLGFATVLEVFGLIACQRITSCKKVYV